MTGVPGILLAVLAMAALLGVLIGSAATLLLGKRRAREQQARLESAERDAAVRVDTVQRTLERERAVHAEALETQRQRERDMVARHEAVDVHSRTQSRRIEALLAEQLAAEERVMQLERALRAQREEFGIAEPAASRRARRMDGRHADVPVLNRRVAASGAGDSSLPQPALAAGRPAGRLTRSASSMARVATLDETEFPVLSEAELPDSVDGLDFDGTVDD